MFETKVILLERSISELVIKLDTFMCMEGDASIENSHIGQFDGNETVNNEEEIVSMVEVDGIDDDNSDNVAETSEESSEWESSENSDSEDHVSSQSDRQERSSSSFYLPRKEISSIYETANEEEIASMTEADDIDDDNSDNVVENQPESEDFISKEVGQPVSAMESEDSDGDREAFWYPELLELQCREDDYDYDYITDYIERAIEKKQAKIQKHKISMYEWKRQKTSEFLSSLFS